MKLPPILIVADRGHVVTYAVDETPRGPSARLTNTTEIAEGQERLSQQLTDKAGAFPVAGIGAHANSAAERMRLTAELRNRSVRRIRERIGALLKEHHPRSWGFAAPSEINGAVVDALDAASRESLKQNLPLDLTRLQAPEVLKHFQQAAF